MPEMEQPQKPTDDNDTKKAEKMSRRKFLELGASIAAIGIAGFSLWKQNQEFNKLKEEKEILSKKFDTSAEGFRDYLNIYLGRVESYIEEYQEHLKEIQTLLNEAEILEYPQNSTEINLYGEFLENLREVRKDEEGHFLQTKNRFLRAISNIDKSLSNTKTLDKQGLLNKWNKWKEEEYLPRKARAEEQMKSLSEQYQMIDKRLNLLIINIQNIIEKAKKDLKNKIKHPRNSNLA